MLSCRPISLGRHDRKPETLTIYSLMTDHVTVREWTEAQTIKSALVSKRGKHALLVYLVHNIIGKSQLELSRPIMAGSQHDVFRLRQRARATPVPLRIYDQPLRSKAQHVWPASCSCCG